MPLLDLKTVRYTSHETSQRPEHSRHLEHHDLLVDVLREELEETVRELRALTAGPASGP